MLRFVSFFSFASGWVRRATLVAVTVLIVLSAPTVARAQTQAVVATSPSSSTSSVATVASSSSSRYVFYGWQNMLVEGVGATAVGLLGLASLGGGSGGGGDDGVALAGAVGVLAYVGGGVVVHIVHENGYKAVGSLGFTLGMPATGALIGVAIGEAGCAPKETGCVEEPAAWGAVVGVLVAPLFDGLILGWEKKGRAVAMGANPTYDEARASGPTVVPMVIPTAGGVMFGVGGTM